MRFSLDRSTCHGAMTELEVLKSILSRSSESDSELEMDEHVRTSITSLSWMCEEEGQVSLSVSSLPWVRDEEGPVSLSVSSLSWMCEEEGPVSLSVTSLSWGGRAGQIEKNARAKLNRPLVPNYNWQRGLQVPLIIARANRFAR